MLPSSAPGRMGLEDDSAAYGRTPFTGWLRLREIRRSSPREPKYPTIAAKSRAICCCTLTFHDRSDALRNPWSIVAGARPPACVLSIGLSSGIDPAAASGVANGGLAAVSRTAVVLGSSAEDP